jgi:DNA-binding XRE family transcriptional regulator
VARRKDIEPVDVEVGARIKERRKLLGLSQANLAEKIGVTFQQVQKYEKGTNRVGSMACCWFPGHRVKVFLLKPESMNAKTIIQPRV